MKEKIKILDLETTPSQETDLLKLLSDEELKVVKGGWGFFKKGLKALKAAPKKLFNSF
ncbi:MAG: hypothetical protein F6K37_34450 [Moorea sp. SIO4E2]|uniref:hypothetical protein n=1 Tax=Moorena sp. SIO4E2 TaxID=2607826 RepID=UPI0013BB462F|nr:hypothetical protein [Moorena sp. SIO4E2]NEQ10838.1 hypothetical protein [Moorena sp. SIO4E2]